MALLRSLEAELSLAILAKLDLNLQVCLIPQLCFFQETESGRNLTWQCLGHCSAMHLYQGAFALKVPAEDMQEAKE